MPVSPQTLHESGNELEKARVNEVQAERKEKQMEKQRREES